MKTRKSNFIIIAAFFFLIFLLSLCFKHAVMYTEKEEDRTAATVITEDNSDGNISEEITPKDIEKDADTSTVSKDGIIVEILDAAFSKEKNGTETIRVNIRCTNHTDMGAYMLETFDIIAFQQNSKLKDVTDIRDEKAPGNISGLFREIGRGETVTGSYTFRLVDDSDIVIKICSSTEETNILAKKTFKK